MSWSVSALGDRKAVAAKVDKELLRYEETYEKVGSEVGRQEAEQVCEARALIAYQIARTPSPYIKVEASGSHGDTWSSVRLEVNGALLDMDG